MNHKSPNSDFFLKRKKELPITHANRNNCCNWKIMQISKKCLIILVNKIKYYSFAQKSVKNKYMCAYLHAWVWVLGCMHTWLTMYVISPRKGIQEILYPDAPGVFLQDRVKELTPMSTTFTPFTAWIGSESETVAEKWYLVRWNILNSGLIQHHKVESIQIIMYKNWFWGNAKSLS